MTISKLILLVVVVIVAGAWLVFRDTSGGVSVQEARESYRPRESETLIIAFGDSLTAGYDLPERESYPAQLEARLKAAGKDIRVVNAGVSGETTRGNAERAAFIRSQNPDIVLLGIGGNDALRLLPIEETKKNLATTLRTLTEGENPPVVFLLRMQAPLNAGLGYKRSFDAIYDELADEFSIPLVPFLTTEIFLNQDLKLRDGIHLNAAGYARVVDEYLVPPLLELLADA